MYTLSNDGSILDTSTFPTEALLTIARCSKKLKNVRRLVLESRLEFIETDVIKAIQASNPNAIVNILTGFETLDITIRDRILYKRETLEQFLAGLDKVAECRSELTAYVLYKPSYLMTDEEAIIEAETSIDFLVSETNKRGVPLTIRLGTMYAPRHSKWAKKAFATPTYQPPRLTDVLKVVERKSSKGLKIYIGLSTEGLADDKNSYLVREDYSKELLRKAIRNNYSK